MQRFEKYFYRKARAAGIEILDVRHLKGWGDFLVNIYDAIHSIEIKNTIRLTKIPDCQILVHSPDVSHFRNFNFTYRGIKAEGKDVICGLCNIIRAARIKAFRDYWRERQAS